eukprot:Gb_37882 [translate_table: standard]
MNNERHTLQAMAMTIDLPTNCGISNTIELSTNNSPTDLQTDINLNIDVCRLGLFRRTSLNPISLNGDDSAKNQSFLLLLQHYDVAKNLPPIAEESLKSSLTCNVELDYVQNSILCEGLTPSNPNELPQAKLVPFGVHFLQFLCLSAPPPSFYASHSFLETAFVILLVVFLPSGPLSFDASDSALVSPSPASSKELNTRHKSFSILLHACPHLFKVYLQFEAFCKVQQLPFCARMYNILADAKVENSINPSILVEQIITRIGQRL